MGIFSVPKKDFLMAVVHFKNKGLRELFEGGDTAKIDKRMHERILRRRDALYAARKPKDMDVSGFNFHALTGFNPTRYTVHVNGPWCVTFEFEGENATQVGFENYKH
jgi:proteic killer suppression protein